MEDMEREAAKAIMRGITISMAGEDAAAAINMMKKLLSRKTYLRVK
ncbi:hypothetical protein [Bacillus marinisedimentorum]|nr:hypothetical protein [Bacillus marinisedimentorum]